MKVLSLVAERAVLASALLAGPALAHPGHGAEPGHWTIHLTEIVVAVALLHLVVIVARRLAAWRRDTRRAPPPAAG